MKAKISRFLEFARHAKQVSGKSYAGQLRELIALSKGVGQLGLQEYYLLGLYDDTRFTAQAKREFAGWKAQSLYHSLNDRSWGAICNDKLAFHTYMKGQGALVADIYAIYHAGRRALGDVPSFSDRSALGDYIRSEITYPFFSKPVHSWSGMNAKLVDRYDPERDELVLRDGTREQMGDFLDSLGSRTGRGHLFQEVLEPSAAVQSICGNRLSSTRVVIMNQDEPRILSSKWKLTVGSNMVDNTGDGSAGNIVSGIEKDGLITRAYAGRVEKQVSWVERHPDTQVELIGKRVPDWDAIREYTLKWARAFPGLKMQAWDVASTTRGIMALEINPVDNTTVFSNQLANQQGILTPEFLDFVARAKSPGKSV